LTLVRSANGCKSLTAASLPSATRISLRPDSCLQVTLYAVFRKEQSIASFKSRISCRRSRFGCLPIPRRLHYRPMRTPLSMLQPLLECPLPECTILLSFIPTPMDTLGCLAQMYLHRLQAHWSQVPNQQPPCRLNFTLLSEILAAVCLVSLPFDCHCHPSCGLF
jgi:hypothetical protein